MDDEISEMISTKCRVLREGSVSEDFVLRGSDQIGTEKGHAGGELTFRAVEDIEDQPIARLRVTFPTHHRITLPNHDMPRRLDCLNVSRQKLFNLVGAVSTDKRDLAWDIIRVDDLLKQRHQRIVHL